MNNFIKLLVSLGLIWLILGNVDLEKFFTVAGNIELSTLLFATLFQLLSTLTASVRWYIIMKNLNFPKIKLFYLGSYFKGSFFNQALPTSIGGDAVRVLDVARLGYRKRDAFYAIFIDRIAGLLGLLLLSLLATSLIPNNLLPEKVTNSILIVVLLGIFGIFSLYIFNKFVFLNNYKVTKLFFILSDRFNRVYRNVKESMYQIFLSLLTHLFSMLAIYMLGIGVGIDQSFLIFLVLVPPAILLTIVPISFAGWGVREGALVALFLLVGVEKTSILAVSIIYGIILIVSSLPGLYVYLTGKNRI